MDEYRNEVDEPVEDFEEGEEPVEMPEEAEEIDPSKASEVADIQRMLRYHPEIFIPYEEMVQERLPVRGVGDPYHTTYPRLTQYERTKAISFRASQICSGAKPYILVPEGVTDAYQIAKMELEAKRLPFIFKRPLPDGTYEYWRLADLII